MSRILVLSDLWVPFPGGAERLIFNVARDLMRRGHEVSAVSGYPPARRFDGPPVTGNEIQLDESGVEVIRQAVDAYRPDVILTHHLYADLFASTLHGYGAPVVRLHYHGPRPDGAALVVHISDHVARNAGAVDGDLVLTPPAFDDCIADSHRAAIGFVKPIPHKGVELVYRIARAMRDRRFVILRGEWQTLETIRRIRNVRFMQPVVDMRDFYREVNVLLVPSRSEDAGTVAQEATLNGLPCLSTAVGGLAETNAGGVLLDGDDPGAWYRAIRRLDDPDVYRNRVESQRSALAALDHDGRLAVLSERIKEL